MFQMLVLGSSRYGQELYHIKHTCRRIRRCRSNDGLSKADYDGSWCCYGSTVWLNFKLPIAAVEGDEVEVLGTKPLVEKGSTSKKVTVSSEAIQSLPIRDLSELYTLQSGVVRL